MRVLTFGKPEWLCFFNALYGLEALAAARFHEIFLDRIAQMPKKLAAIRMTT
jgi:hypothetical protein